MELTIAGDRQTGKSYAAMKLAIDAAKRGERVLYTCDSSRTLHERFRQLQQLSPAKKVVRVRRAHGDERIDYRGGGSIVLVVSARGGGRGITADMHVIDDDRRQVEANPTAQRVIRTKFASAS